MAAEADGTKSMNAKRRGFGGLDHDPDATAYQRGGPEQRHRLREFFGRDRWLLVVLDACRYDVFNELYPEYGADLVLSSSYTSRGWFLFEWWDGRGATYVTPNPFAEARDGEFDLVFTRHGPGGIDYGPQRVVEGVSAHREKDRLVAHFVQPHEPYLVDGEARHLCEVEEGRMADSEVHEFYRDNLRRGMVDGVEPLLDSFDRSVAITADHAELLGEGGRYGHDEDHPKLREVPWVEVP